MNNLRDQIIEILEKWDLDEVEMEEGRLSVEEVYTYIADQILALLPQWISVEDRLPERGAYIFIFRPSMGMKVVAGCYSALYSANKLLPGFYCFDETGAWNDPDVTHWMPLPNPPKEGE